MSTATDNEELWSIALPGGEIRRGTIDQLDDAFNAGLITNDSLVLAPGATEWARLGELAGLEAPSPTPPPVSVGPSAQFASPMSLRPVMIDASDSDAPIPEAFRSKKPLVFGALAGVAALAGTAALIFTTMGGSDASASSAAAAVVAPPKPTVTAAPPPPPAPTETSSKPALTDAQRKALQDADDARARAIKARTPEPQARGSKKVGIKDSTSFATPKKTSGPCTCKHGDPLCSCL